MTTVLFLHTCHSLSEKTASFITSTVGQEVEMDSKETFKLHVYYPIIDIMIGDIERRFRKLNCGIMKGIQALNPPSSNFLDEESIALLAKAYDADMEDLKHELHQTRRILSRKKSDGQKVPVTLIEFTRFLEPFKEVFFELFHLTKIAVVLLVSSASCERSFSTLKLVKTHLCSTMSDSRLSNLAILSIESERSKALDMDVFIKRFSAVTAKFSSSKLMYRE